MIGTRIAPGRAGDRTIDMLIGREVDDGVDGVATEQVLNHRMVADVSVHQAKRAWCGRSAGLVSLPA